jgi:large subunit ribosomal protein L21
MYAVFSTGGKQYRAVPGEVIRVELIGDVKEGDTITIDQVMMVGDGDKLSIGAPLVKGATVSAKVRGHGRADKIRIVKFRRRKHFRKETGHRQHYTEIEITGIAGV